MTINRTVLQDKIVVEEYSPGKEIIIGTIVEINALGEPVIDYMGNMLAHPLPAMTTVSVNNSHIGRQVAILFANGKLDSPVIMGLIHSPLNEMIETYELSTVATSTALNKETARDNNATQDIKVDGKRITLEGADEVVLRCGDASITLTRAGKILIRGKYLLNRSDGVNRIMGGSVQVN